MDFYAVLGIPADADHVTIRRAYRILARRYHPDSGASSSAEKFRQVTEAYETLSEPSRRNIYDLAQTRTTAAAVRVEPITARYVPRRPFDDRSFDLFTADLFTADLFTVDLFTADLFTELLEELFRF
jgi:DnaJ-class molecular chaperone